MEDERSMSPGGTATIASTDISTAPPVVGHYPSHITSSVHTTYNTTSTNKPPFKPPLKNIHHHSSTSSSTLPLPGSGNNSMSGGNDSASQLSDSGDETGRKMELWKRSSHIASPVPGASSSHLNLHSISCKENKRGSPLSLIQGSNQKEQFHHDGDISEDGRHQHQDTEIIGMGMNMGGMMNEDTASVAVNAPESISGDGDTRSISSVEYIHGISTHHGSGHHPSGGSSIGGGSNHGHHLGHHHSSHSSARSVGSIGSVVSSSAGDMTNIIRHKENDRYNSSGGGRGDNRRGGGSGGGGTEGGSIISGGGSLGGLSEIGTGDGNSGGIGGGSSTHSNGGVGRMNAGGPPGRVMIAHHHDHNTPQYHHHPEAVMGVSIDSVVDTGAGPNPMIEDVTRFPTAMSYAASEAAKSDIATVCSGSVVEDIEIASVMSGDLGTTSASHTTNSNTSILPSTAIGSSSSTHTNAISTNHSSDKLNRRKNSISSALLHKHERGVEFAVKQPSAIWTNDSDSLVTNHDHHHTARHSSTATPTSPLLNDNNRSSPTPGMTRSHSASGMALNDMGPPLSRSLLLGVGDSSGPGSVGGGASHAGSVRSFGSQAASDLVCVDTDDCGGSLVESDGRASSVIDAESHSIHSQDDGPSNQLDVDNAISCELSNNSQNKIDNEGQDLLNNDARDNNHEEEHPTNNLLHHSRLSNGRTSPGGTVYKGRGVRRYQGRYMHLPLKRFHQNGVTVPLPPQTTSVCGADAIGSVGVGDVASLSTHDAMPNNEYHHPGGRDNENSFGHYHQIDNDDRNKSSPPLSHSHHHNDRWARRRPWLHSRSRSRSRSRDRIECNRGGRRDSWSRSRSRSQSPPLRRSHSRSPQPPPSCDDRDRGSARFNNDRKLGNTGGGSCGGSRWRSNRGGRNINGRGDRGNNAFRRGGVGGGGHYRSSGGGSRQQRSSSPPSRTMPPRDSRHNRDGRRKKGGGGGGRSNGKC